MNVLLLACLTTPFYAQPLFLPVAQDAATVDLRSLPAEGTILSKHVQYTAELVADDLEVWMDGQPVPSMYLPELEMKFEFDEGLRVVDTYRSIQDGQLQGLIRRFDESILQRNFELDMTQGGSTDSQEYPSEGTSPLVGKSVAFTREGEDWKAELVGGEDAVADLEALAVRLDFAAWALPTEAGAKRWSLPGEALAELIHPSGDLSVAWSSEESGERLEPVFGGEIEFVRKSVADAAEREVSISGSVAWRESEKTDLSEVPVADGRATQFTDQELELKGSLVWNVDSGHLVSMELQADVAGKTRIVRDADQPGAAYESHTSLGGEMSWEVQFEAIERRD